MDAHDDVFEIKRIERLAEYNGRTFLVALTYTSVHRLLLICNPELLKKTGSRRHGKVYISRTFEGLKSAQSSIFTLRTFTLDRLSLLKVVFLNKTFPPQPDMGFRAKNNSAGYRKKGSTEPKVVATAASVLKNAKETANNIKANPDFARTEMIWFLSRLEEMFPKRDAKDPSSSESTSGPAISKAENTSPFETPSGPAISEVELGQLEEYVNDNFNLHSRSVVKEEQVKCHKAFTDFVRVLAAPDGASELSKVRENVSELLGEYTDEFKQLTKFAKSIESKDTAQLYSAILSLVGSALPAITAVTKASEALYL